MAQHNFEVGLQNTEHDALVTHAGEITYEPSRYGVLLPTTVRYRKIAQRLIPGKKKKDPPTLGQPLLMIDNIAQYSNWQMFAADAEIKFTPLEAETPTPPKPQP